jgi:hypothetical protein
VENRPPVTVVDFEAKSVASGSAESLSGSTAEVDKFCAPRVPVLRATRLDREISELYNEIKRMIARHTALPDDVSALATFWAISTWFKDILEVHPILVIAGLVHEASTLLILLQKLCYQPLLLAGFKRTDLTDFPGRTLLFAAPNFDNRSAALLGSLANPNFLLSVMGSVSKAAGPKAVYVGENSAIERIPYSVRIDVTVPPLAHDVVFRLAPEKIDDLQKRLLAYRTKNRNTLLRFLEFKPRGLALRVMKHSY